MEPLGAAVVSACPGKSRRGKIEFTAKPAIGAPDVCPMVPPTSRQRRVFGTSRCGNVATEVPAHKPFIKPRTIPAARKTEKTSTEFSEKPLRNPRKVSVAVPQTPITSSPGSTGSAWVDNPKPKLKSSPPFSGPKPSSQKTGQVDPKPRMSVCSLEKSPSNPKEDSIVVSQILVASTTAAKKFYNEEATDLNPKPKTKGICLPGMSMGNLNLMEDDEAVPQTPVTSFPKTPNSAAPFAVEKPSTNEKTGEIYPKLNNEIENSSEDDITMLPTPSVSYVEKSSSDDKTSGLGLNLK
ncbi:hypothetical protein MLD38_040154 [Melastoma candidum]|uniref:Uncharacterized protein n=1 Tax=Melastoma candidum TaxID=119954 RepID=A0ACB9L6L3_9MYRT|nr:hypothetical protein MLD38_040154 [Melastoma candidum]